MQTCKHASAVDIGSLKISDLSEVWDLVSSCENDISGEVELAHGPRVELVVERVWLEAARVGCMREREVGEVGYMGREIASKRDRFLWGDQRPP